MQNGAFKHLFTPSPLVFLNIISDPRFIGLSALAEGPMDARSFVRASVRASVTRYLEIRESDFSETWHKVASWRN